MKKKLINYFCIILFHVICISGYSQEFSISGVIRDSETSEPLPFVNIVLNNGNKGGTSDLNGRFLLKSDEKISMLTTSYVGYVRQTVNVEGKTTVEILLVKNILILHEVSIFPGVNPADRIIENAVAHKKSNSPFQLNSFSYTSYNRFQVTVDTDELNRKNNLKPDSNYSKILDFTDSKYFFLMEDISIKKFLFPSFLEEEVIAYKTAGFDIPLFTLFIKQIQPFTFYDDFITISDKKYVNPVSKGSTDKYLFILEDTLPDAVDSVFVISFRPLKNTNFSGLQGLLYINSDRWAIQNVIASPADDISGLGIKIQQQYERIGEQSIWFPTQLQTEIIFKTVSVNNVDLIGQGRTFLKDIFINPPLRKSDFGKEEISFNSDNRNQSALWEKYRGDLAGRKDSLTYFFLDSIGKVHHLDRKADRLMTLMTGKIPVGLFSFPINSLVRFNDFEGWRLGISTETNQKFSKTLSGGLGFAYGFKDRETKYSGFFKYKYNKKGTFHSKLQYNYDVDESGYSISEYEEQSLLNLSSLRNYLLKVMDYKQELSLLTEKLITRNIHASLTISARDIHSGDSYLYGQQKDNIFTGTGRFEVAEVTAGLLYDAGVKRISISGDNYTLNKQSKSPKIQMFFVQTLPLYSSIDYHAVHLKCQKSFSFPYAGTSSVTLIAGMVRGQTPYQVLYVFPGVYRKFGLYIPETFLSYRTNEFIADTYLALFLKHDFGQLLVKTKFFTPEFSLASNIGFGSLTAPENHRNRKISTPVHGMYEFGVNVDNLVSFSFYSFGACVFYRVGTYSYPDFADNLMMGLSLKIIL